MDGSFELKREELSPCIQEAYLGRDVWRRIKDSCEMTLTDVLIMFPKGSDEISKVGINLLEGYTDKKKYTKAVILLDDHDLADYAKEILRSDKFVVKEQSHRELSNLLRYYRMVQFYPNIVVISCAEPYASDGLWRSEKVSVEDYVENTFYV